MSTRSVSSVRVLAVWELSAGVARLSAVALCGEAGRRCCRRRSSQGPDPRMASPVGWCGGLAWTWRGIELTGRTVRAALTVAAVTVVAVLGFAGVAQAHVTVNPNAAVQGGYARVAFRVPTESD